MNVVDIAFQEAVLTSFSRKNNSFTLTLTFTVNGTTKTYEKICDLENPETLALKVIKEIKSKSELKSDKLGDFLDTLVIARVKDVDRVEEKFSEFLRRAFDKFKMFKLDKNYENYVQKIGSFDKISMKF